MIVKKRTINLPKNTTERSNNETGSYNGFGDVPSIKRRKREGVIMGRKQQQKQVEANIEIENTALQDIVDQ